ncbi:hypothetical protein GCM10028808_50040 [Spirosoma migulaei]
METPMVAPVAQAFEAYKSKIPGQFKPDKKFYSIVGINRKRFAQLLRGETKMYTEEAKRLANLFEIPVTEIL